MKNPRLWLAALAVFLVRMALNYLVHQVWLRDLYHATANVWRPEAEMQAKLPVLGVAGIVFSLVFVYVFARGYQNRGLAEGLRYGLVIGCLFSLTVAYENYVVLPIPYDLALKWFLSGLALHAILGLVAALIYRPARP